MPTDTDMQRADEIMGVTFDPITAALSAAYARGRRAGMKEAAVIAEDYKQSLGTMKHAGTCRGIAAAIRAKAEEKG